MSADVPPSFHVEVSPEGSILLRGELDMATIQALQNKIDEILVPGRPIVLDLAQLTFLDSSAVHCFIKTEAQSGHPVLLMNASRTVRRLLDLMTQPEPQAWIFNGEGPPSAP
jgi:anti-anti-sigma factor